MPLMAKYNPIIYNVTWDSPSQNAAGTMPIGNGDIGANVYAIEDGDLYLLLSKNDAFNYCGDLLKTGRVKISLSPNPFERGEKFRQTLDLATGSILIETRSANIRVWSDMNNPICHVDIDSKQDIEVTVTPDPWERYDHGLYNTLVKKNPNPVAQDVVKCDGDQLVWYYHVGDFSVLADDYAYYGVEHLLSIVDDPYKYNTFGNLVKCDKLQADGESISGKGRKFEIMIHSLLQRTPDPKSWVAAIKKQADEYLHSDLILGEPQRLVE